MSFGNFTSGSALNWRAFSFAAAAAAGLALCATACGGPHSAAPAVEQQVLNIYNWADYVGYQTIAEFERRTHIKVVYERYDSNQTLEAKMLAGRSGYDIVSTALSWVELTRYRPR
jgi:spermidine/putrescine-binding protein